MPRCSDHVSHRGESAKLWRVARQWARCLSPASSRAGNNVLSSLPRAEREEERSSRPWRATPQTFAPVGSPLDCGSSSYRLPASVDTASVQGKAKAATDFLVHALAPFPYKPRAEGGSRRYRSPRQASPAMKPLLRDVSPSDPHLHSAGRDYTMPFRLRTVSKEPSWIFSSRRRS